MKAIFFSTILFSLVAFIPKNKIRGTWETRPSPQGNVSRVVFFKNHSMDLFVNKKLFTTGKYKIKKNTITLSDTGCDGSTGVYKLIFFSNSDSLRFEPVYDTCSNRKRGMSRIVLGKIK